MKAEELRKSEARARIQKIIVDDDDDNLGFYAVHPNTIYIPVSQNVEPKDSLIMGDGHINTTPETRRRLVKIVVLDERKIPSQSFPIPFLPLSPFREFYRILLTRGGFSGFWKIHGSILWKDKAMPTISIDDLQSSLHKVGNLLSLSLCELKSILLFVP
ncbi:hypothetical protein Tco_1295456 [Tanacetum coccineum]